MNTNVREAYKEFVENHDCLKKKMEEVGYVTYGDTLNVIGDELSIDNYAKYVSDDIRNQIVCGKRPLVTYAKAETLKNELLNIFDNKESITKQDIIKFFNDNYPIRYEEPEILRVNNYYGFFLKEDTNMVHVNWEEQKCPMNSKK